MVRGNLQVGCSTRPGKDHKAAGINSANIDIINGTFITGIKVDINTNLTITKAIHTQGVLAPPVN